MATSRALALVSVLLVAAVFGGVASAGSGAGTPAVERVDETRAGVHALVSLQVAPETDNTITRIVVHENGSATWELRIRTRLSTDAEVSEYRAFQERFRANTSRFVDDFRAGITGIVADANAVTGREMGAAGFRASTSIQTVPRRWGVVSYEFRWNGFAAVEGDRLVVGDVFEGGLFIAEGDALEVVGPPGYHVESVAPAPDESGEGTVAWQGREDFADGRPQVVFAPAGADSESAGGLPRNALLGGALLLVVVGVTLVAAVGVRRWRRNGGVGPAEDGATATPTPSTGGDEELLADEDYVRRALSEHDGRMRQSEVKDALGWSRSKTSRVLGRMEEAGAIRKLQLGRENVIDLADGEGADGDG